MLSGVALPVWGGGRESLDHPRCLHPHPPTTTGAPHGRRFEGCSRVFDRRFFGSEQRRGRYASTEVRYREDAAAAAAPLPSRGASLGPSSSSSSCGLLSLLFVSARQQKPPKTTNTIKETNATTTKRDSNLSVLGCAFFSPRSVIGSVQGAPSVQTRTPPAAVKVCAALRPELLT